jgi:hypothetical protein
MSRKGRGKRLRPLKSAVTVSSGHGSDTTSASTVAPTVTTTS